MIALLQVVCYNEVSLAVALHHHRNAAYVEPIVLKLISYTKDLDFSVCLT